MILNQLRYFQPYYNIKMGFNICHKRYFQKTIRRCVKSQDINRQQQHATKPRPVSVNLTEKDEPIMSTEIFPTAKVVPMVLTNKEPVILSFDDVPGPKALKHLARFRQYLSEVGTQLTAGFITIGLNVGKYIPTHFT